MPPPIGLFMTTIASNPILRKRQEYVLRILQAKKIPFTAYDLASDEEAKRLWRRKAPPTKQQLPGILIGGKFPGTIDDFEDAVEHGELAIFLRLNESWDPLIDEDRPMPAAKPVGIPGAYTPNEMTPEHLRAKFLASTPSPSPLAKKTIPINKRTDLLNVGEDLSDFGLSGVQATMDELKDLLSDLGLEGEAAGDLAKGLSNSGPVKPLKFGKKPAAGSSASKAADALKVEPTKPKSEDKTEDKTEKVKGEPVDHHNTATKELPTVAEVQDKVKQDTITSAVPKLEVKVESEGPSSEIDSTAEVPKQAEEVKETPVEDLIKSAVEKIEEIPSKQVPDIENLVPEKTATAGK